MPGDNFIPPTPSDADYADDQKARLEDMFNREDPFALFGEWLQTARESEPNDPNAMALATADADGMPDARMVLLKGFDEAGFVFYTNIESAKGEQLGVNAKAALCFHWKSLRRQVRVRGAVHPVSDAEADAYFQSRARDSRIGAWASIQSRPMDSRETFEKRFAEFKAKFEDGEVPRPDFWRGYRVAPLRIEFWRDRAYRLHDRLVFERDDSESPFRTLRLYP